jgi:hypothetical protein
VREWVVRDTRFDGFWCETDPAGPAVRFTRGSRDVEVYRNVMMDVAQGVVLGEGRDQVGRLWPDEPCGQTAYLQAVDAAAWNNIVAASSTPISESNDGLVLGLGAESSCNVRIVHNSVFSENPPAGGSIHHRYGTTNGVVANNLVSHDVLRLEGSTADSVSNVENAPYDTWYFPAQGDYHTAPGASRAIDQGAPAHAVADDVDGEPRDDGLPDAGADEQ